MAGLQVRLVRAALICLLVLIVLAAVSLALVPLPFLSVYFFMQQDLPVAVGIAVLFVLVRSLPLSTRWSQWPETKVPDRLIWLVALVVLAVGVLGSYLIFRLYPLSMDEFWARADGVILATGKPMAPVAEAWRPFAHALQPIFLRLLPEAGLWSSNYLPVNAVLQLIFGPLASPLLTALSVLLVASIARRLMPEHRFAPLICALLFASSSQLLLMAMTPYAMSAHLAFNLAWLWLFLKRRMMVQVGAMAVGFLATGLHQFVFFPLFAAPFLFEGFLSGRRGSAVVHSVVILLGILAWSNYDSVAAAMMQVTPSSSAVRDTGQLFDKMLGLILGFDLRSIGLTAMNLLRFQIWQNPMVFPLALFAAPSLLRSSGPMRAALGGCVLVTLFMLFVLPFQGHGWGYRYLHGFLGNLSLLATCGWYKIANQDKEQCRGLFAAMLGISVVMLLPLHAVQAWKFVTPYVRANEALNHVDADVVVIDAPGHAYTQDLVRNSPLLDNQPKRLAGFMLDTHQLAQLCAHYRLHFFRDADAERFGIFGFEPDPNDPHVPLSCGD